ncbi:uncharacterized protein EV422DRAFT_330880 [Fimicolochytrium jonesii]|uniref:uncharacterized protein n=1 Tax=Fimicolochytrium jonesii TaxID=1396493 RepID=UPI0022FE2528|nr:uncharacterized protein EV422DRAFT_330880 [Fimicolochytrium jonesii]KAI8816047.1 hypothetical protein EV422DRAFT_330880 [Fimicolochytrium jonesii]
MCPSVPEWFPPVPDMCPPSPTIFPTCGRVSVSSTRLENFFFSAGGCALPGRSAGVPPTTPASPAPPPPPPSPLGAIYRPGTRDASSSARARRKRNAATSSSSAKRNAATCSSAKRRAATSDASLPASGIGAAGGAAGGEEYVKLNRHRREPQSAATSYQSRRRHGLHSGPAPIREHSSRPYQGEPLKQASEKQAVSNLPLFGIPHTPHSLLPSSPTSTEVRTATGGTTWG